VNQGRLETAAKTVKPASGAGRGAAAAAVFLAALALYIRSTVPFFLFDDNSEFIASAHLLGITHPPGYALFSLAGKLFSFIPAGEVFFAVNLLSAFFAAGVVALVFRLLLRITGSWAPAVIGAAMAAVARTLWIQAGQAEVYAPNLFFILLLIDLAWGLAGTRRDMPRILAMSATGAFAILNHYTPALIAPVLAGYVIWLHRRSLGTLLRWAAPAVFVAAAVFSVWMYLPMRSAANPKIQWKDQTAPAALVHHLKGVDRRADAPHVPAGEKIKFMRDYGRLLWRQWTPFLLLLVPVGLAALLIGHGGRGWVPVLCWVALFGGFTLLLNYLFGPRSSYVVSVFHTSSIMLVALAAGAGAGALLSGVARLGLPPWPVFLVLAGLVGFSAVGNREFADNSSNMLAVEYGKNILRTMARDGIVFSRLETESFPIASLRAVSGMRRDILLFGNQGDSAMDVYTEDKLGRASQSPFEMMDLEREVLTRSRLWRPVYFTFRRQITDIPGLVLHANGLLYQVNPNMDLLARSNPWDRINMDGVDLDYPNYDYITRNAIRKYFLRHAERFLQEGRGEDAEALLRRILAFDPGSRFLRNEVAGIYLSMGMFDRAREEYEKALEVPTENVELSMDTMAIYNNLSYVYGRLGMRDKALETMERAVELAPDTPVFLVNLGQTYWEMGRYADAITPLERALELGSGGPGVHNILGICYEKTGDYLEAEKHYETALETGPGLPDVYRDYGIYNAYVANRPGKAAELLEKYLELTTDPPDETNLRSTLGLLYFNIGQYQKALHHLNAAALLGAADNTRRMAIIQNTVARSYERLGRNEEADSAFRQALQVASVYPEVYRDYAEFLVRSSGGLDRAVEMLEKYLRVYPGAPDGDRVNTMLEKLRARLGQSAGKGGK